MKNGLSTPMGIDAIELRGRFASQEHWEGLRSSPCKSDGRLRAHTVLLSESWLVLHEVTGRAYRIGSRGVSWRYVAKCGTFDYYPAGSYDVISAGPDPMNGFVIRIPVAFENSVLDESGWVNQATPRHRFWDGRLETLVKSLSHGGVKDARAPDSIMLSVALVDRVHEVIAPSRKSATGFSQTVRRLIVEYIDVNIDHAIRAERIALLTGLAPTQFLRTFKATFGLSLHQYVIARKVEIARMRLLSEVCVSELAYELGFSSHAHFSTVFRKVTGLTPSQFRTGKAQITSSRRGTTTSALPARQTAGRISNATTSK